MPQQPHLRQHLPPPLPPSWRRPSGRTATWSLAVETTRARRGSPSMPWVRGIRWRQFLEALLPPLLRRVPGSPLPPPCRPSSLQQQLRLRQRPARMRWPRRQQVQVQRMCHHRLQRPPPHLSAGAVAPRPMGGHGSGFPAGEVLSGSLSMQRKSGTCVLYANAAASLSPELFKPPTGKDPSRPTTRADGQGRPVGKVWAWLQQSDVMHRNHAAATHGNFSASLAERIQARQAFAALPGAEQWLSHERPVNPRVDTPEGEPSDLP